MDNVYIGVVQCHLEHAHRLCVFLHDHNRLIATSSALLVNKPID